MRAEGRQLQSPQGSIYSTHRRGVSEAIVSSCGFWGLLWWSKEREPVAGMSRTPAAWPSLLHHPNRRETDCPGLLQLPVSSLSRTHCGHSLPGIFGSHTRSSLTRRARGTVKRWTVPTNPRITKQEVGQQDAVVSHKNLSIKGTFRHK